MKRFSAYIAAFGASVALIAMAAFTTLRTEGHWIYTLDDAYIHLALAKNFALYGVWGLSPDTYTFCSSSPLWTLLLAGCMKVFGFREWIPGVLNILCVALIMWRCDRVMERNGLSVLPRLLVCVALFFITPLTVVASTGMEHCLHMVLILYLLTSIRTAPLLVFAFLSTAARFESLAVIVPLAGILLLDKRWKTALAMVACGIAPIFLHGFYAQAHGGFFFPNSILLKGHMELSLMRLSTIYLDIAFVKLHVVILCALLLFLAGLKSTSLCERKIAFILVAAHVAQLTFGEIKLGNFYRYEIYIILPSFLLLATILYKRPRPNFHWDNGALAARLMLLFALCVPLAWRGFSATRKVRAAAANIYEQQCVMARMFNALPGTPAIAINDLGAVSWYCANPILDLWGLGTTEIAAHKRSGTYNGDVIAELMNKQHVEYIATYESWFPRAVIPAHFQHVAQLVNVNNVVCAEDRVQLYAMDDERAAHLREALSELQLPSGTTVTFLK